MATQVGAYGATVLINKIIGASKTFVSSSAPTSWIPGQEWYNTGTSTLMSYNGTLPYNTSDWVATSSFNQYICLLTADPGLSGPSGGPSVNISDLVEDTTSGYARQTVSWTSVPQTSEAWPCTTSNSNNLTFGPYTANQASPVQWAALISSINSSGTLGTLLYYWDLVLPQQVQISQSITLAAGSLSFSEQ